LLLGYEEATLPAMAFLGEPPLDSVVEEVFQQVRAEDPALLVEAERELTLSQEGAPPGPEALSFIDGFAAARRAVAWAVLLRRSRLDITRRLLSAYPEVELFTPLTVDMAIGLLDTPEVSLQQQLDLQEKISRLSMLGRLVPGSTAQVHPFVGFDPRSEVRSRKVHDVVSALDVVHLAIEKYGFIGVKLYPPMGFRPIRNDDPEVDAVLEALYTWCEAQDVPITVHCNASNAALPDYLAFSEPGSWAEVLDKHEGLRLNLGHFGGARVTDDPHDPGSPWPGEIAALASRHAHLYADTGDHRIDDPAISKAYLRRLTTLFSPGTATAAMRDRLMYGSDWYMLALLPSWGQFLTAYRGLYEAAFGKAATGRFMGEAALEFLGFTDATSSNRGRLMARYEDVGVTTPAWLQ
jgi:predicted TIM-barrel fold metal-dependent hydrolase